MKVLRDGLKNLDDFEFSAVKCGIRYEGRLDYALIHSRKPCNASGLFTKNRIFAAPVKLCRERINNSIHTILINATNANACTGENGYRNAVALTDKVAERLNIPSDSVLMASTGIIGVQLPVEKMADETPELIESLSADNAKLVSRAIMTTDTYPKESAVSFHCSKGEYKIGGVAKGSGMIAPDMATLLSFILTNASVSRENLDIIFRRCIAKTYNSLSIDGDMSTNDTAILLSPDSDNYLTDSDDLLKFEEALTAVLTMLSEMIVDDGEGTTKCVKIIIKGAKTDADARKAARAISDSLLVKTAMFGNDPNWGRIACAAGYSGAVVEEDNLSISFEDVTLFKNGKPVDHDEKKMKEILLKKKYTVNINLGIGDGETTFLTSDISYDYVKINSEYTT